VRGMVLGDRSLILEDLEVDFRRSGITHTFPTSGKECYPKVAYTTIQLCPKNT
jgi:hypothetical protein